MARLIGVDVGGTFTDIVVLDDGAIVGRKVPTSPDQSDGVVQAVAGDAEDAFLHGTTAATNALLEERGARVVLVTEPRFLGIPQNPLRPAADTGRTPCA